MTDPNTFTVTGFWAVFFLACMIWGFGDIMLSIIIPGTIKLWRWFRLVH